MKRGANVIAETLRKVARSEKDFDLYDATWDADFAFRYLGKLYEERKGEAIGDGARTIEKTLRDNTQRYRKLKDWVNEEPDDFYRALYQAELDILEAYCYATITRLRQEKEKEIDGLKVTLTIGEPMKVENNDISESSRKRKATEAAKIAVGGKGRDKLSSEEEIQTYDDAWNEAYTKGGGADESAMNPARRYSEEKERKAQKKREEEERKAQKEREEEERKASEESKGE